jgi:hypothetical protein
MRRVVVTLAVGSGLLGSGCALDFNRYEASDAGNVTDARGGSDGSGGWHPDAGPIDAASEAGCMPDPSCLSQAMSCASMCQQRYQRCTDQCRGNDMQCTQNCTQNQQSCDGQCVSQCSDCAASMGCRSQNQCVAAVGS